ncbi:hypothetical protein Goklo_025582, partial [Gossypium klotzschianum]|nr:hypothetical protein [Gossypium klotzschianum]
IVFAAGPSFLRSAADP